MERLINDEGISKCELDRIVLFSHKIGITPHNFIRNLRKCASISGVRVIDEFSRLRNIFNLR